MTDPTPGDVRLQRCTQDTLCTLPNGNHPEHYDCRDGLTWTNYGYEPPAAPGLSVQATTSQEGRATRWRAAVENAVLPVRVRQCMALADEEAATLAIRIEGLEVSAEPGATFRAGLNAGFKIAAAITREEKP